MTINETKKIDIHELYTYTKKEIAKKIVEELSSENEKFASKAEDVFAAIVSEIIATLENGTSVMIKNIGTFAVNHKAERKGVRNPKTGEELVMPACCTVTLKKTFKTKDKLKTSELIARIHEQFPDVKVSFIQECLNIFTNIVNDIDEGKTRVELRGFGVFYPVFTKAKVSRNPQNGNRVDVPAKIKLRYSMSKLLRKHLNPAS